MARRSAFIRAMLGGAAAFMLALGGATAASADPIDPAGSISGTVTRAADGSPVGGVTVSADGAGGNWKSTHTEADGSYVLEGLPDDSYIVSFYAEGENLKREYWAGTTDYSSATPVVVTGGASVPGIDAAMKKGAVITGTVTRADDGTALAGVSVSALDEMGEIAAMAETDVSGAYELGGLLAGSYRVRFGSSDPALGSEYWDSSYSWDDARVITLSDQQAIGDVDADLDVVGYISGTVTKSADGSPAAATVLLYGVDTPIQDPWGETDSNGDYRIAVAPGTYRVLFHSFEVGVMEEYWQNARMWEDATLVTVAPGQEITAIDGALEVVSTISGTVTLDSLEDRTVTVEAWADGELAGSAAADPASGKYTLNVPEGTYVLKASATFPGSTTTAKPQYYDGADAAEDATPVAAVGRATLTGIDFTLEAITVPAPKPTLTVAVSSVRAGGEIAVTGEGFASGETVRFELHSDPIVLGTLRADAGGRIDGTLRIPASVPAGAHTLVALGEGASIQASLALQVQSAATAAGTTSGAAASPAVLASTGAELPAAGLVIGLFLVIAGGVIARRRVHG